MSMMPGHRAIMDIKIIYGTETHTTRDVLPDLLKCFKNHNISVTPVNEFTQQDLGGYDLYILASPTWYSGGLPGDWEERLDDFKSLDFTFGTFAIFGLGDSLGYPDHFIDGVGVLAEIILQGGGRIVGRWPSSEYDFDRSLALTENNMFYGLGIDDDNEPEKTKPRFEAWVEQIKRELKSPEI